MPSLPYGMPHKWCCDWWYPEVPGTCSQQDHACHSSYNSFDATHPTIIPLPITRVTSCFDARKSPLAEYKEPEISKIDHRAEAPQWDLSSPEFRKMEQSMLDYRGWIVTHATPARGPLFINCHIVCLWCCRCHVWWQICHRGENQCCTDVYQEVTHAWPSCFRKVLPEKALNTIWSSTQHGNMQCCIQVVQDKWSLLVIEKTYK